MEQAETDTADEDLVFVGKGLQPHQTFFAQLFIEEAVFGGIVAVFVVSFPITVDDPLIPVALKEVVAVCFDPVTCLTVGRSFSYGIA